MTCIDRSQCAVDETRIKERDCPSDIATTGGDCGECVKCPDACTSCSTFDGCDTCATGFKKTFPPLNACTAQCGEGTFIKTQGDQKLCQLCNPLCATCSTAYACDTCKAGQSPVQFNVDQQDYKLCMCDDQV